MVTEEVIPTPCCYKLSLEPLPGHGFPLKVAAGFCHEPDHVQLHLNESSIALKEGGGAHTSVAGSTGTLSSAADSTSLPATFHASTCDTILWPSTSLNVTSSGREFNSSSLWPHEHNNPSAVSGNKSSLANVEEDEDLMVALAKFLGVSTSDSSSESEATTQSKSHGLTGLVLLLHPLIYRAAWLRWLKLKVVKALLHYIIIQTLWWSKYEFVMSPSPHWGQNSLNYAQLMENAM